jgi:hypothetical protein
MTVRGFAGHRRRSTDVSYHSGQVAQRLPDYLNAVPACVQAA